MSDPDGPVWHVPRSLAEALELKQRHGRALRPAAGCTDLLVEWQLDPTAARPDCLDLSRIEELERVDVFGDTVRIGAAVTCTRLRETPVIRDQLPMLAESCACTGSVAIQNRATLGGNIMNASPAADNPPVLLAYGAQIELANARATRVLDYADFHTGYRHTRAARDELLTAIIVRLPAPGAKQYYRKVGTRRAQAISKVALAACIESEDKVIRAARFGFASLGPVPLLARHLGQLVTGRRRSALHPAVLRDALLADIAAIDDQRSTREYRVAVATNLVLDALGLEDALGFASPAPR